MVLLSVNVNKFALIRNSRGTDTPNLCDIAKKCIQYGADGITIHPRPDERHATKKDVPELKAVCDDFNVEFNVEGYPSEEFLDLVCHVKPTQVTLVPDPPEALTSSFGWNLKENQDFLSSVMKRLADNSIRSSIFVDPTVENEDLLKIINPDQVELYTFDYAHGYTVDRIKAIEPYIDCVKRLKDKHVKFNAGHDLSLDNLAYFLKMLPDVEEVSIGHALVCDAFERGLKNTISEYKKRCEISQ